MNMKRSSYPAALTPLAAVLCACNMVSNVSLQEPGHLQCVAIAPLEIPEAPRVRILHPVGNELGWPGAMVEEARSITASQELQDILAQAKYDYKSDLEDSLHDALAAAGIATVASTAACLPSVSKLPPDSCAGVADADACLFVTVTYVGYTAQDTFAKYQPAVHLTADLVRVADDRILFDDFIHYNDVEDNADIVIPPSGHYRFKSRAALKADPQAVSAGIQEAVQATMAELARQVP